MPKCPQCVICIIVGLLSLVLLICALAIYFDKEKSKINFAFLSIGVDYFQIISLFAQTGIPWPPWLKELLQWLSIFNFNIDIAAPECLIPDFDYTIKWWVTILLPLSSLPYWCSSSHGGYTRRIVPSNGVVKVFVVYLTMVTKLLHYG